MKRPGGRRADQLRPVAITRGFTRLAHGSVLIETGVTRVLCTASFEKGVPAWRQDTGLGWVTAEYDMLPASTGQRRARNRNRVDGRTQEIQRLIGRSMRTVVDLSKLGENTIWLDCDVLQADGGTRTAGITGAYVALCDAVKFCIKKGLDREISHHRRGRRSQRRPGRTANPLGSRIRRRRQRERRHERRYDEKRPIRRDPGNRRRTHLYARPIGPYAEAGRKGDPPAAP